MSQVIKFLRAYFKEPVLLPPPDRSVQRGTFTDYEMIRRLRDAWRHE